MAYTEYRADVKSKLFTLMEMGKPCIRCPGLAQAGRLNDARSSSPPHSMTSTLPVQATQSDINLTPVPQSEKKQVPEPSKLGLVCHYSPSPDGVDENLLILLHGFGDTNLPFAKLAQALKLPQTATLAVRGPELIPYLLPDDPPGYQYYPIYTLLGEPIASPNPTLILSQLVSILKYLLDECGWTEGRIHLFGFGQGGSVAVELTRLWAREYMESTNTGSDASKSTDTRRTGVLGSVTTISGPLLSHPTPYTKPSLTPLLVVHRPGSSESALAGPDVGGLKKGFGGRVVVEEIGGQSKEGMPTSRDEWMGIMRFWADVLGRRVAGEDIYRVE